MVKNLPANAGDERDSGSIPGSGRSPGRGNCNPLEYSCLEKLLDSGAKIRTGLGEHTHMHTVADQGFMGSEVYSI